jgi:Kdo2-lipid IVA lauroyltransferase/acyltransferase
MSLRRVRHDIGYWALRAVLAASGPLPLGVLRAAGSALGAVAGRLARQDRERALAHLALAFPEAAQSWRDTLLRACARHLGTLLGEVTWLWSASRKRVLARTSLEGLEHLTGALADGRGALLVTGHCGNWEWMNLALCAAGVPMTVAAREVYDARLDEVVRRLRGRFGGETVLRGEGAGRKLARALHSGRVIGLLIDQDIDAPGVFVEFFGHPAWTPSGAAVLALRSGRPVITGFATRRADGGALVRFDPPLAPDGAGDPAAAAGHLTALLTARIEAQIRSHPAQWVWMHRRWRRRPRENDEVWRPESS